MSAFIEVPPQRLEPSVLTSLLEDFASRDGTDYGEVELTLEEKTGNLRRQLQDAQLRILFNTESEEWDVVSAEQAALLLEE